jgi:hypothetical protein
MLWQTTGWRMEITVDVKDALYSQAREFAGPAMNDSDLVREARWEFVQVRGGQTSGRLT